jgi:hypothetical protein
MLTIKSAASNVVKIRVFMSFLLIKNYTVFITDARLDGFINL